MELSTTPDKYEAGINAVGDYIDRMPNLTNGITCDCMNRKKQITIFTKTQFNSHIKSQAHITYIQTLNNNKNNYYMKWLELSEENRILKQQLTDAHTTIDVLTLRTRNLFREQPTMDLLGMNEIDI
jgi:hypothetical protein